MSERIKPNAFEEFRKSLNKMTPSGFDWFTLKVFPGKISDKKDFRQHKLTSLINAYNHFQLNCDRCKFQRPSLTWEYYKFAAHRFAVLKIKNDRSQPNPSDENDEFINFCAYFEYVLAEINYMHYRKGEEGEEEGRIQTFNRNLIQDFLDGHFGEDSSCQIFFDNYQTYAGIIEEFVSAEGLKFEREDPANEGRALTTYEFIERFHDKFEKNIVKFRLEPVAVYHYLKHCVQDLYETKFLKGSDTIFQPEVYIDEANKVIRDAKTGDWPVSVQFEYEKDRREWRVTFNQVWDRGYPGASNSNNSTKKIKKMKKFTTKKIENPNNILENTENYNYPIYTKHNRRVVIKWTVEKDQGSTTWKDNFELVTYFKNNSNKENNGNGEQVQKNGAELDVPAGQMERAEFTQPEQVNS